MKYILIKSRHQHKDIKGLPAIFDNVSGNQIFDFDHHKKIIHRVINPQLTVDTTLELYVTGLTPVLMSVINYCRLFNISIVLYHYNSRTHSYVPQSVV